MFIAENAVMGESRRSAEDFWNNYRFLFHQVRRDSHEHANSSRNIELGSTIDHPPSERREECCAMLIYG